jgi:hypothetical protein
LQSFARTIVSTYEDIHDCNEEIQFHVAMDRKLELPVRSTISEGREKESVELKKEG